MDGTRAAIERFVSGKTLAVVGVSAGSRGFGRAAYRELKTRGYRPFPIHPTADVIDGDPCYRRVEDLPEQVDRLLVVVKPDRAEQVVRDAASAGIRQIWLQQGASSPGTIELCRQLGLEAVHGHCILMFAEPAASFHRFHRWLWGLLGKIPRA
jgi:hypothetical protein